MFLKRVSKLKSDEFYPKSQSGKDIKKIKVITFYESDAVPTIMPQSDALVISMIVGNHKI